MTLQLLKEPMQKDKRKKINGEAKSSENGRQHQIVKIILIHAIRVRDVSEVVGKKMEKKKRKKIKKRN